MGRHYTPLCISLKQQHPSSQKTDIILPIFFDSASQSVSKASSVLSQVASHLPSPTPRGGTTPEVELKKETKQSAGSSTHPWKTQGSRL